MSLDDEIRRQNLATRRVIWWREVQRTLLLVILVFFLIHIVPDLEAIIHAFAQHVKEVAQ